MRLLQIFFKYMAKKAQKHPIHAPISTTIALLAVIAVGICVFILAQSSVMY